MAIMYQTNPLNWHLLGRWLVTTKYLSLVNILADRELVPEFMPYFRSVEPIIETVSGMLNDKQGLTQISSDLLSIIQPLVSKKAGPAVARIALDMLSDVH